MPWTPPPRARAATRSRFAAASPKSLAKRSSAGGHAAASDEVASAAMRTRVSRMTASPRAASSATREAAPRSSIQRARKDRGRRSRAARMPRSSTKARTRQAVSVSRWRSSPAGIRPARTSCPVRSRITSPSASTCGTTRPRSPGRRAISRKPARACPGRGWPGRRVARRRRARSSGVSTSKRVHGCPARSRTRKPPLSRQRAAVLSVGQASRRSSARGRSGPIRGVPSGAWVGAAAATTKASALKRLLATTSPGMGDRSSSMASSGARTMAPGPA